jgi:hypothetical protein
MEVSVMSFKKTAGILSLGLLAAALILTSTVACSSKAKEGEAGKNGEKAEPVSQEMAIKEGLNDITGQVKSALGKYFYVAQMPGFDIAAGGNFDAATLLDKDVKLKVEFNRETPSLLVAQSIDVQEDKTLRDAAKEGLGQYKNVYTAADKNAPADYFGQKGRAEFAALKISNIMKSADWEGKGKVKIRAKYIAGAEGKPGILSVLGDKDAETAKIIVDNISEYASYYLKKLRLFDKFDFYLNITDSVPANQRAKAKEVFHADVVFAGLY